MIKVHGSLTNAYAWWHPYAQGSVTSYEAIADALSIAVAEEGVHSIYLDIASGGGVVRGLDIMSDTIRRADSAKPVYAHTDSHMFSAALWAGVSARRVTASRMSEVGSIGTLLVLPNYTKALAEAGVEYHVFRAGEFKALGLPFEELSDEAKAYIQDNLDKTNKFFLEHVSRRRNLMMSEKSQWAEGKTFFAEEGLAVGLIDQVTTLADLLGSGASTTHQRDPRRFEMNISQEKLAQIAAGADPKVVLTAEELEHYEAALASETEEPEEGEGEKTGTEGEGDKPAPVVGADVANLLKENGKLEAKLEAALADSQAKQAALGASQAQLANLLVVAKAAVCGLQTALGQPREAKATAGEVVAQFNDLQGQMAKRFPVGRQTAADPTTDSTKAPAANASFRH
ncbi:signal peptide peptidase SppA, 36K type [compost metagenome]